MTVKFQYHCKFKERSPTVKQIVLIFSTYLVKTFNLRKVTLYSKSICSNFIYIKQ